MWNLSNELRQIDKFHMKLPQVKDSVYRMTFQNGFYRPLKRTGHNFNENAFLLRTSS